MWAWGDGVSTEIFIAGFEDVTLINTGIHGQPTIHVPICFKIRGLLLLGELLF